MLNRIISALVMLIIAVFGISILQSEISRNADKLTSSYGQMLQLSPIFIMTIAVLGAFLLVLGGMNYITYRKWYAFGNRLKEAYMAKFGYNNNAFNLEVDQHVLVMKALGHGPSKTLAEDWLKRMAKFVEVPWAIPEEEQLSEEDKTSQYKDF